MIEDPVQMTIGEVARRTGVATSAIRYYESIGLLPPPDRLSGQRRYDHDVLGKLAFIEVAQSAGFRLGEITDLMRGLEGPDGMGDRMRALSDRKLGEVEEMLARAEAMRGWLQVARGCDCETPAECALFPSLGEVYDAAAGLRVVMVGGCRRRDAGPGG